VSESAGDRPAPEAELSSDVAPLSLPLSLRDAMDELLGALAEYGREPTWSDCLAAVLALGHILRRHGEVHCGHRPRDRRRELMAGCWTPLDDVGSLLAGTDLGQLAMTFAAGAIERSRQNEAT